MAQLLEFIGNHPLLVGSLVALLTALAFTEMRRGGQGITSAQLTQLVNQQGAIVVDVREKADYSKGHIVDSISMPFSKAQERVGELSKHKDKPIVIVDAQGQHSGMVGKQFKAAGLDNVMRLNGGIATWTGDGLPLVKK